MSVLIGGYPNIVDISGKMLPPKFLKFGLVTVLSSIMTKIDFTV